MSVGEDHVVGVGDAGVGGEAEGGEDRLAATVVAGERVRPEQANRSVNLIVRKARRQVKVVSVNTRRKGILKTPSLASGSKKGIG